MLRPDGVIEEGMVHFEGAAPANGALAIGPGDLLHPADWQLGRAWHHTGKVNLGLRYERGNRKKDNMDLDMSARLRREGHRIALRGEWEVDERDDRKSKDKWLAQSDYNYFFEEHLYATGSVNTEADEFAELNLRTTLGSGIGWQVYENPAGRLHLAGAGEPRAGRDT